MCPTGKLRYETKDEAKRALRRIKGTGVAKKPKRLKAYRCPQCGWWHLGNAHWREKAYVRSLGAVMVLLLIGCGGSGQLHSRFEGYWFGAYHYGPNGGNIDMAVQADGSFRAHHFNTDTQTYADEMVGRIEGSAIRGQLGHEFFEGTVRMDDGLLKVQVWESWVMSRR